MIIQIDIQGKTIIEKFDDISQVNKHFDKIMHPRIIKLLNRDGKDIIAHDFLWAKIDPKNKSDFQIEKEALNQVQDLVLQRLFVTTNIYELNWSNEKIKRLIFDINN